MLDSAPRQSGMLLFEACDLSAKRLKSPVHDRVAVPSLFQRCAHCCELSNQIRPVDPSRCQIGVQKLTSLLGMCAHYGEPVFERQCCFAASGTCHAALATRKPPKDVRQDEGRDPRQHIRKRAGWEDTEGEEPRKREPREKGESLKQRRQEEVSTERAMNGCAHPMRDNSGRKARCGQDRVDHQGGHVWIVRAV